MPDYRTGQALPGQDAGRAGPALPAVVFVVSVVMILAGAGIGARYCFHGGLNLIHSVLGVFFSINLLICYWEICLFLRRDYVAARTEHWRERRWETARSPALEFLTAKVPLARLLSPTTWADVWATYSQYDDSYADRRTFGYNADIANGFVTPAPTMILYAAYTVELAPAPFVGILGTMLFWQWTYVTSVYWASFFVSGRQNRISRTEMYTYILSINSVWVLCALLGLYVSIRLVVDGNYDVLGF